MPAQRKALVAYASLLAALLFVAVFAAAQAHGTEVEAVAGETVTLEAGQPSTWEIPNRQTVKDATSTRVKYETPGVRLIKVTPAPPTPYTIRLTVKAKTAPPTAPTTNPAPPATQPAASEQPAPGQRVVYVTSGQGTISAQSNTFYTSAPGTRATVRGIDGIKFSDGDQNVTVYRIDFLGTSSTGHGLDVLAKNVRNVRVVDCSFSRFGDGVRLQHPRMTAAPRSEYIRDVVILRTRVMDMTDTGDKGGHGLFACGVDGLTVDECLIDGAGWQRKTAWVHGVYAKEGTTRVVVTRNIFRRCASVGVQLRGPLIRSTDPDDGSDPGPIVTDNVFDDCAIAIMLNGPRATETGNAIATGHHHLRPDNNGQGGTYNSVGRLRSENNVLVSGPRLGNGPKFDTWRNAARPQKDEDAKGEKLRWERTGETNTEGGGNRADRSIVVDLSAFADRARDSMSADVTREAQAAVRRAVGE